MKPYFEKLQSIGLSAIQELRPMDKRSKIKKIAEYRHQINKLWEKFDAASKSPQNAKCIFRNACKGVIRFLGNVNEYPSDPEAALRDQISVFCNEFAELDTEGGVAE